MPTPLLHFANLSKHFGDRILFAGLGRTLRQGCLALCDESGTGRSTLLAVLAGALPADAGEVWIDGRSLRGEPEAARAALAYVPEDCTGDPLETGRAFLERIADLRNTPLDAAVTELIERFALAQHLDKRFEQMSLGTRRKLFLTSAMIGPVRVVIADEPTGGLDASAKGVLGELFKHLGESRAVFFTSYDAALIRACGAEVVSFAELMQR
jgi:ABC-2 type transport system ATP-binding protein